jgi:hypothetical protein
MGMFVEGVPLSDFDHASFGAEIADRKNAYAVASGTELLFTPLSASVLHPLFKIAFGGSSVGYLVDTDGEEGFDEARGRRFFFASASAGAELNVSRFFLVNARIGGRYVDNAEIVGLDSGGLSGLEIAIGVRFVYGISIE